MADLMGFNANEHEEAPNIEFTPLPAGTYEAVVTESEVKPTKNGLGHYLQCNCQVIAGEQANKTFILRFNIQNPSATSMEIGLNQLSQLCKAVGVLTPGDSVELHDLPFLIDLKVKSSMYNGERWLNNEIKKIHAKPKAATPAPAASASNAAPWARKPAEAT